MSEKNQTLYSMFQQQAESHSDDLAFVSGESRLTFAEFLNNVDQLANGLVANGVAKGERVCILAQNSIEYLELFIACAKIGAIYFPLNWRLSSEELLAVISYADPKILVVGTEFLSQLEDAVIDPATLLVVLGEELPVGFAAFGSLYTAEGASAPEVSPDDPAAIISTAATEGVPRGAVLSQRNFMEISALFVDSFSLTSQDRSLVAFPLFHVSGLISVFQAAVLGGASVIQHSFDPAAGAKLIDEYKITQIGTFPPMLDMLLDAKEQVGASWDSLRACFGILNPPETIQRFLAETNGEYWTGFGQTETTGIVTLFNAMEKPGSAGKVVSRLDMRIVNEAGEDVPVGTPGEIAVQGSLVFSGYWRDEDATEYASRFGWHHTGDVGKVDQEGYLYYLGRKPEKELIKSGGENVYPAEVEHVIRQLTEVADVCIFGVPDEKWGEAVKAVIELAPGSSLDAEQITQAVADSIASYKKPQFVDFVEHLPRLENGEVDRASVKAAHVSN